MARNTALTETQDNTQGTKATAFGYITFPATAIVTTDYIEEVLGFVPNRVVFTNVTDRITIEWQKGMADNTCVKTAANGTRTLETTNGGITPTATGFRVTQNATLAAIAASKDCMWVAYA
jgi:hypothetical protein